MEWHTWQSCSREHYQLCWVGGIRWFRARLHLARPWPICCQFCRLCTRVSMVTSWQTSVMRCAHKTRNKCSRMQTRSTIDRRRSRVRRSDPWKAPSSSRTSKSVSRRFMRRPDSLTPPILLGSIGWPPLCNLSRQSLNSWHLKRQQTRSNESTVRRRYLTYRWLMSLTTLRGPYRMCWSGHPTRCLSWRRQDRDTSPTILIRVSLCSMRSTSWLPMRKKWKIYSMCSGSLNLKKDPFLLKITNDNSYALQVLSRPKLEMSLRNGSNKLRLSKVLKQVNCQSTYTIKTFSSMRSLSKVQSSRHSSAC